MPPAARHHECLLRLDLPTRVELSRDFPFNLSTDWRLKLTKCIAFKGKRKIPMKAHNNISCAFYTTISFSYLLANAARLPICMALSCARRPSCPRASLVPGSTWEMAFVWFLLRVPKLCSSFKLQGIGVAGDQQDFLKTDFVVKHRGLFVSLSLGNLTSEMCVSRWPCPMCCKGRY